jgi:hypothetical protein
VYQDAVEDGMIAVRLKCPADLPANEFYARYGFLLVAVERKSARPLSVWELRFTEDGRRKTVDGRR